MRGTKVSGVWYIRYRVGSGTGKQGKLVRRKIGGKQDAIDAIAKVRGMLVSDSGIVPHLRQGADPDIHRGKGIRRREDCCRSRVTLGVLCDELLERIRDTPLEYRD